MMFIIRFLIRIAFIIAAIYGIYYFMSGKFKGDGRGITIHIGKNINLISEANAAPKANNAILTKQAGDITLGSPSAKLLVIEYSSLSCPHCAHFNEQTLSEIKKHYINNGKLRYIHRDFPLDEPSLKAALLARCYGKNNPENYYNFLSTLFKTQGSWATSSNFLEKLESIAAISGMSKVDFRQCVGNKLAAKSIMSGRALAQNQLQMQSTPTIFVGNEKIEGFRKYNEIKPIIEKALKQ